MNTNIPKRSESEPGQTQSKQTQQRASYYSECLSVLMGCWELGQPPPTHCQPANTSCKHKKLNPRFSCVIFRIRGGEIEHNNNNNKNKGLYILSDGAKDKITQTQTCIWEGICSHCATYRSRWWMWKAFVVNRFPGLRINLLYSPMQCNSENGSVCVKSAGEHRVWNAITSYLVVGTYGRTVLVVVSVVIPLPFPPHPP